MSVFGQVVTAMVTPFDEELKLDLAATEKLVEHLIENGSDAIVVAGTTGEGPTLSKEEKIDLFKHVAFVSNGRVKVIANVGTNNTYESVEFAKEVEKLGVVDGLMVVNPYYNKPSQKGLYEHYKTIANSVDLPILLYNIPGRTSVNLDYKTTVELSKIKNIVAIKESSGDLAQIAKVIEYTDDHFSVYSGDDDLTLPIVSIGGDGVVSVASHIFGKEIKEMIQNKDSNIHRRLIPFFEEMFFTTNPVPVKHNLTLISQQVGSVRLPLVGLTSDEQKRVQKAYTETSEWFEKN